MKNWINAGLAAVCIAASVAAIAQEKPVMGGRLTMIAQPEPPILVTPINQQAPTLFVGGKIYESLLKFSPDLKPLPSLAKAWKVTDDGLIYVFELQQGVKWHDGKPFTAADVVFNFEKFLKELHPRWRLISNNFVESVAAMGDYGVRVKLKQPYAPFLNAMDSATTPLAPKHIYDGTDYRANPANNTPVGTGPFKFKEWKKGSYIHLVKNESYWKPGQPYLNELYFRIIPDAAQRSLAFERGEVQALRGGDVEGFDVKRLRTLPNVQFTTKGWELFSPLAWLQLNLRRPPFDNKLVRQAIYQAIDRKFIIDNIFFGLAKPASGPLASTTLYYEKAVTQYPYDLAKAKQLIAQSGLKPEQLSVKLLALPYGQTWDRTGEYVKQQLEQIGMKVTIESTDTGGWAKRAGDFDFDMTFQFTYQFGHPALGVARHYLSTNQVKGSPFGNNHGWNMPSQDAMWQRAASTKDPKEAAKIYSDLQKAMVDEVVQPWLMELDFATLYRSNIRNLVTTAIGLNETFDNVWLAK